MLRLCVCPSDKLDGLRTGTKRKRDWEAIASRMEDYLQLPDDYDTRASEPGKKRVRDFVNDYRQRKGPFGRLVLESYRQIITKMLFFRAIQFTLYYITLQKNEADFINYQVKAYK